MKTNFLRMACVAAALLTVLWSCQKETLTEETNNNNIPELQGQVGTVCDPGGVVGLATSTGNTIVDYCGAAPCTVPTPWGSVTYSKTTNGFPNATLHLTVTLAPGWFASGYEVAVDPPVTITTSGNVPVVGNDWTAVTLVPNQTTFEIDYPLLPSQYGASCFNWALRVHILRLNFFGQPDPASLRDVYAYDPTGAGSPFVIDDCYAACPAPTTETQGTCQGCRAQVTVAFDGCDDFTVTSCKTIRQVVIVYDDCSREYHDNLSGTTFQFQGNGTPISHVYVRSGCRANFGNAHDDQVDTNGFTYHNVRRFRFNSSCVNPVCN